jgi:glycosyltransferase involved in cell wall biosynthesis
MRILSITAGAAGMYCGSCFRDNTLAAELLARGHDVLLVPVYTPTRTDEPNVSHPKVVLGGINVYLQQHVPLFRRTPWLFDRMWDTSFVLNRVARGGVSTNPKALGELTISMLKGEHGHQRKEVRKLAHWLKSEPPFDVVNLPNSLLIGLARPLKEALGRPICCTLQGEDLFLEGMNEPHRSEARALITAQAESVDAFLAVSRYYADFMSRHLALPSSKMRVVPIGINVEGYDRVPRSSPERFTIGYFARVAPEKGLHVLCEAYRKLRLDYGLPEARLEVGGYLGPDHVEYLRRLERAMGDWGLRDEFRYRGTLNREQKIAFLRSLSVFSVPSTYAEPKGLYLLEALAAGVPVVQPRLGAFPEILERTGGGILYDPPDADGLAAALISLFRNLDAARELGYAGAAGVRQHYTATRMAERALDVYQEMLLGAAAPSPQI